MTPAERAFILAALPTGPLAGLVTWRTLHTLLTNRSHSSAHGGPAERFSFTPAADGEGS